MILTLILIAISAMFYILFNEMEDESIKSNWKKYQHFLNTNKSWKNKWKLDSDGNLIPNDKKLWYYLYLLKPKYTERYMWSSTILVAFTDGEHLFQFLKNIFIFLGFLVLGWQYSLAFLVGKSIMTIIKELFLDWLK